MARNNETGYECALKVMREEYVKMSALEEVMREVEIMTQLDHPNIARLIEYNTSASAEFVDGESAPVFAMSMEI